MDVLPSANRVLTDVSPPARLTSLCPPHGRLIILSNITSRAEESGKIAPSAQGKAIICFDDQCIITGEIDDSFDVSVLDEGSRGAADSREDAM